MARSPQNIQSDNQLQDQPVKLIIIFGSSGVGKSFFGNYLIQKLEEKKEFEQILLSHQSSQIEFCGVVLYCANDFMILEFEGIDYSNNSEVQQKIKNLLQYCAKVSACVFYVHQNCRANEGVEKILSSLKDTANGKKNFQLIEILNKWNGDNIESYKQSRDIFDDVHYLKALKFKNKKINQDQSYDQYIKEIEKIHQSISKLSSSNRVKKEQLENQISENKVKLKKMYRKPVKTLKESNKYQKILSCFIFSLGIAISISSIKNDQ